MSDFPDVSSLLIEAGGAIQVQNNAELLKQCGRLLEDRDLAKTVGARARAIVDEHQGISQKVAADIAAFLEE